MKELRETDVSSIKVIDDWCSLEELQYLIWSFEYDGDDKALWEEVRQGEKHFPRKLSSYVYDATCRSTRYIFAFRDKLSEEVQTYYKYPNLFGGESMIEGLVDTSFVDGIQPEWQHYEVMLFLNDDYEGGEICFRDRDIIVTPRAGSVLMFPAKEYWTVKEIKGTAYKMRIKLTDMPQHREDDPTYAKVPYRMRPSPSRKAPKKRRKSKGCKGCVEDKKDSSKEMRVEMYNPLTGQTEVSYRNKKETEKALSKLGKSTKKRRKDIII